MNLKRLSVMALLAITTLSYSVAQTPLWQGKGRIAISSDGNEHDDDDWAATPLSLAMLAAHSLQDEVVLYTYSDHIWGSNGEQKIKHGLSAYEHMRKSALGAIEWFGFDKTNFICAVDYPEVAYEAMKETINESSEENPLIIVAAGPMQVVGEAMNRADKDKRQYVTLLSHSGWNDRHSDDSYRGKGWGMDWDSHSGWTWKEMEETFGTKKGGNAKFVHITDQNGGKDYDGLCAAIEKFDWIKTSPAQYNPHYKRGSWNWLYERIATCIKEDGKSFDPSDAGLIIYLLTGVEKTEPYMAKEIMENPTKSK